MNYPWVNLSFIYAPHPVQLTWSYDKYRHIFFSIGTFSNALVVCLEALMGKEKYVMLANMAPHHPFHAPQSKITKWLQIHEIRSLQKALSKSWSSKWRNNVQCCAHKPSQTRLSQLKRAKRPGSSEVSRHSEIFISVPGQRDTQHMCSAICCVPWIPLTNLYRIPTWSQPVSPNEIHTAEVEAAS